MPTTWTLASDRGRRPRRRSLSTTGRARRDDHGPGRHAGRLRTCPAWRRSRCRRPALCHLAHDPSAIDAQLVILSTAPVFVERSLPREAGAQGRTSTWASPGCEPVVDRLLLAAALVVVAVVVAFVRRRRPGRPDEAGRTLPTHLDRGDFDRPDAPWLVAVFTSATCRRAPTCRQGGRARQRRRRHPVEWPPQRDCTSATA